MPQSLGSAPRRPPLGGWDANASAQDLDANASAPQAPSFAKPFGLDRRQPTRMRPGFQRKLCCEAAHWQGECVARGVRVTCYLRKTFRFRIVRGRYATRYSFMVGRFRTTP